MKPLLLSLLLSLPLTSFAQDDAEVDMPIEVNKTYNGINIKFIFREFECGADDCHADFILGLQDPNTVDWAYVQMEDVGFFSGGFDEVVITLQDFINKPKDMTFIGKVLEKDSQDRYRWRCKLNEIFANPKL